MNYRLGILTNSSAEVAGRLLSAIAAIVLAKELGQALFGKYFSDQALVLIGAGLYNMGIGQGYRQIVSRDASCRAVTIGTAIFVRLAAITIYFSAVTTFLFMENRLTADTIFVVIGTLLLTLAELYHIDVLIQGRYARAMIIAISKGAVMMLPALVFWLGAKSYVLLVGMYCLTSIGLSVYGIKSIMPFEVRIDGEGLRRLIRTSMPFMASIAAFGFSNSWAINYIRVHLGDMSAGIFVLPWKVYQVGLLIAMSSSAVVLPLFHKLAAEGSMEMLARVLSRWSRGLLFIAGMVLAIFIYMPAIIVKITATDEYLSAVSLFPFLGCALVARVLSIPGENVLECMGLQRQRVGMLMIGAAICGMGVAFLVPRYGVKGGAITALIVDTWLMIGFGVIGNLFAPRVAGSLRLLLHIVVLLGLVFGIALLTREPLIRGLSFLILWICYGGIGLALARERQGLMLLIRGKILEKKVS